MASAACIKAHSVLYSWFLPAVHVRRCPHNVPQARYPESAALAGITSDGLGARVDQFAGRVSQAQNGQLLIGKKWWRVAFGASGNE